MKIPDCKIQIEERPENGSTLFWLKHNYIHGAFEGLPADGPYASEAEAKAARARLVAVIEATLKDED